MIEDEAKEDALLGADYKYLIFDAQKVQFLVNRQVSIIVNDFPKDYVLSSHEKRWDHLLFLGS